MSDWNKTIDKLILGKSLDEVLRDPPSLDEIVNRHTQQLLSKHPLRDLGTGTDISVLLSEESRQAHDLPPENSTSDN